MMTKAQLKHDLELMYTLRSQFKSPYAPAELRFDGMHVTPEKVEYVIQLYEGQLATGDYD